MQMFRVAQCFKEQYYAALLGERGFIHFLLFCFVFFNLYDLSCKEKYL